MLNIFLGFIITFIEITALLILWSKFQVNEKKNISKQLFIALVGSLLLSFTARINQSYSPLFSYLSIIICTKSIYNKPFIKTTVEVLIFSLFINIFELAIIGVFHFIGFKDTGEFIFNFSIAVILLVTVILIYYYINQDY